MAKPTISSYIRENLEGLERKGEPGPFVTISCQYGCDGFELGDLLLQKLDEQEGEGVWKLYKREIISQLADDTGLSEELIEREKLTKPSLLRDLFRGVRRNGMPDGYEIRNKISLMARAIAFEGHAIIIGQGGTSATADLDNGLRIRIEAPRDWRVTRISVREKLKKEAAVARVDEVAKQRRYLHKSYKEKNPREPAFNLTIDNSLFDIDQASDLVMAAMELRSLTEPHK
ncbi:MAG: cytidylate kinase-like family protein [Phycisphaerae bacterium]|nr:cytidylate kinase-like family protein [Phycisphaerae bacterium]